MDLLCPAAVRPPGSLGVEARGLFAAAAQRYFDSPPNSDLYSFSGLVVPCARWKVLFGCAFVEFGQFSFTVPGDPRGALSDVLFSFGPRAGVDVPIAEGFSIRGIADLPIRPYTPGADVTDHSDPSKPVYRWALPIVNGFFGVGIAWAR